MSNEVIPVIQQFTTVEIRHLPSGEFDQSSFDEGAA